jgi:hypothetical protein
MKKLFMIIILSKYLLSAGESLVIDPTKDILINFDENANSVTTSCFYLSNIVKDTTITR